MVKAGVALGLTFATLAVVAIVVIVIIILVSRLRPSDSSSGEPLDQNPLLDGILCSSNDQCTSGACNTNLGICVDCLKDGDCGGSLPYCLTETNKCVECLETSECDSPATCVENECCQNTPPVITGATATFTSNQGVNISYDIFQPRLKSKVLLVIEDPATGWVIGKPGCPRATTQECVDTPGCESPCFEFPATSPVLSLKEANVRFRFYGGYSYRFRMQVAYRCGTNDLQITDMSDPFIFTMPVCPDTDTIIPFNMATEPIKVITRSIPPQIITIQSGPLITLTLPRGGPDFSCTILASDTPGVHPSLAPIEFGGVTRDGYEGPELNLNSKVVPIPFSDLTVPGNTYYFRVFKNGNIGECDGALAGDQYELSWTY